MKPILSPLTPHFLPLIAMVLLLVGCAKMGQPDGGWYDEEPPKILGSSPQDKSVGVSSKKITIYFDEFIKLDNPSEKVVISPPQQEQAEIKGQGKKITVELQDSLLPNTTYTIDFSDAITDNNEDNPLGNYTYSFSTGDHIDTLEVSGYILEAEELEPIKGILVGLYQVDGDSADIHDSVFQTKPLLRVSRTDSRGHFVIKGIADGNYRVFALQDVDANYMYTQKSEKIAYNHEVIHPTWKPDIRQDTIWRDSLHILDIKQVPYTHFMPDNIVLRAYTEILTDRYLVKFERNNPDRFTLYYSYGDKQLPHLRGLNYDHNDAFVIEPTVKNDTITYWLRDTMLVNQDTLRTEVTYMMTDSLGNLVEQIDTLELLSKVPYEKRLKLKNDEYEKWKKKQDRLEKKGKPFQTEMPQRPLDVKYDIPSSIAPDQRITMQMPAPLSVADTAAIHLYSKIDTLWYRTSYVFGEIPQQHRSYQLIADWREGTEYSLEIDSAAFVDIYGTASKPFKQGFKVNTDDTYGNIFITINRFKDSTMVVQLLNKSDKVVKEVTAQAGVATFRYVKPDKYYMRMYIDSNNNGQWDTGEYGKRQAETVYYYPDFIECRAKWDVKESWNPEATPLYRQKPGDIIRQKADKQKKQIKSRNAERARSMGIDYIPN